MENREVVDSKKMRNEFIGGIFLYGTIYGLIYIAVYWIVYFLCCHLIKSDILFTIMQIAIETIFIYFVYKASIKSIFKKRTIEKNQINDFIKKYIAVCVIILVVSFIINIFDVNSTINDVANSQSTVTMENILLKYYDDDEIKEYYEEKENTLNEVKTEAYGYLIMKTICFSAIYCYVIFKHKETIYKYV